MKKGYSLIDTLAKKEFQKAKDNINDINNSNFSSESQPQNTNELTSDLNTSSNTEIETQVEIVINPNQYILFSCLELLDNKESTLNLISKATNIPAFTLRSNLFRLRDLNVIEYKRVHIGNGIHGFKANILNSNVVLTGDEEKVHSAMKNVTQKMLLLKKRPVIIKEKGTSGLEASH